MTDPRDAHTERDERDADGPPARRWRRGPERWARHGPPPWWPEGEAWPPSGGPPPMRGAHRLGCFFMLAAIVAGLALLMGVVTMGRAGGAATIAIGVVLGVMFLMFLGLVTAAFGMRRMARPVEALVDAAQRVAAGDYAVRVAANPWGPPSLRTLSRAFNSMAERLEADAELRRRLLADTSHELRTPLTALQGELEAMLDGVHEPSEAHLRSALEETQVLAQLIEDLRTLSLAESGALRLHLEPTDLGALLREVADGLDGAAARAGVSIEVRIEVRAGALPELLLDALRVREVVANLVVNGGTRRAPAR